MAGDDKATKPTSAGRVRSLQANYEEAMRRAAEAGTASEKGDYAVTLEESVGARAAFINSFRNSEEVVAGRGMAGRVVNSALPGAAGSPGVDGEAHDAVATVTSLPAGQPVFVFEQPAEAKGAPANGVTAPVATDAAALPSVAASLAAFFPNQEKGRTDNIEIAEAREGIRLADFMQSQGKNYGHLQRMQLVLKVLKSAKTLPKGVYDLDARVVGSGKDIEIRIYSNSFEYTNTQLYLPLVEEANVIGCRSPECWDENPVLDERTIVYNLAFIIAAVFNNGDIKRQIEQREQQIITLLAQFFPHFVGEEAKTTVKQFCSTVKDRMRFGCYFFEVTAFVETNHKLGEMVDSDPKRRLTLDQSIDHFSRMLFIAHEVDEQQRQQEQQAAHAPAR
jgi:hypothetical protein